MRNTSCDPPTQVWKAPSPQEDSDAYDSDALSNTEMRKQQSEHVDHRNCCKADNRKK
jgi:hypothetical protein